MSLNLWKIIENLFGTRTTYKENRKTNTVGNTVTKIVSADPKRLSLIIVNLGNVSIFIAPAEDVSSTKGIVLIGNGGNMTLTFTDDFELVSAAWYGISTAPGQAIYTLETVSEGKQAKE